MNKLRVAVIGVGYLGKFHAEKFKANDHAELIAVCDVDSKRCDEIAAHCEVEAVYNYQSLVGQVDAVSIAAPTLTHYEIAKFFLENAVHALVEKPITSTVVEAEELVEIAKLNKVKLQVGHLERFNPVMVALQDVLKKPLFIESLRLAPYKVRGADVNVILDLMIHDIDLIQHLVNSPIKIIQASGAPVLSDKADIVSARIEFDCGCVANVTASRISFTPKRLLRIFQYNAYFSGDLHNKTLSIHRKGVNEMFPGIPEILRENLSLQESDALADEVDAFLRAIIDKSEPLVSGADGMCALRTATQITQIVTNNLENLVQNNALF